jgi:NAD(P)-dependent dehydrogenase (short-subunit alcohol dehydrogenase family)
MSLQKVAVITGGTSGLGFAAALKLAAEGYQINLLDLYPEDAQAKVAQLPKNTDYYQCDVTDAKLCSEIVDKIQAKHGQINVLLNAAGYGVIAPILSSKPVIGMIGKDAEVAEDKAAGFAKILAVNVIGTYNMIRFAAAKMVKNTPYGKYKERGVIVNISSTSSLEGQNGQVMYGGSKAAVNGMTMPVARDLGKHGIRCVCIAPGPINTPMTDSFNDKIRDGMNKQSAIGRMGEAEEFGQACMMVVNSSFMTGNIVRLDGGIRLPKL